MAKGLSRAQRRRPGGAPTRRAEGELSAPVSEPGRFTRTHLWLARERPDRNIRVSSGRSPERELLVGSSGRVRGARPRPEPAPYVRRGDCFGPAGLAMTDPSPPEPRAHAWVQGKHTLSPGRGKYGLDALRPSTNWPGGRRSARRPAGSGGSSEGFPSVVKAPRLSQLGFKRIL